MPAPDSAQSLFAAAVHAKGAGCTEEAMRLARRAVLRHPRHAPSRYLLGHLLARSGAFARAVVHLEAALERMPDTAIAWSELGNALAGSGQFAEALACCDKIHSLMSPTVASRLERAGLLARLRRFDDALKACDEVLELEPGHLDALFSKAYVLALKTTRTAEEVAGYRAALPLLDQVIAAHPDTAKALAVRGRVRMLLGDMRAALSDLERSTTIDPASREALYDLSFCLIQTGDWERGWPLFEHRFCHPKLADRQRRFRQPQWGGEPLAGKSILLHTEQGLGDTLQFVRFVPAVKAMGARVALKVQPPLVKLLAPEDQAAPPGPFDFHCSLMSLPAILGLRRDAVPGADGYLSAPKAKLNQWRKRLGSAGRLRVGLAWSGNPDHANDINRSLPLDALRPLFDEDADFICLQNKVRDTDIDVLRQSPLRFFGDDIADFTDTAALCCLVDVVISVDTSVAHLAGALGRPLWLMLSEPSEWRWMCDVDTTPWYDSARLFRQPRRGDWDAVIAKVRTCLAGLPEGSRCSARRSAPLQPRAALG